MLLADTGAAPTANANGTRVNIKGSGLLSGDVALDSITLAGTAAVEVSVGVTAAITETTKDTAPTGLLLASTYDDFEKAVNDAVACGGILAALKEVATEGGKAFP